MFSTPPPPNHPVKMEKRAVSFEDQMPHYIISQAKREPARYIEKYNNLMKQGQNQQVSS